MPKKYDVYITVGIIGAMLSVLAACSNSKTAEPEYVCDVVIELIPSIFKGQAVSPEGSGTGRGVAPTRDEALAMAFGNACGKFDLYPNERAKCQRG